MFDTATESRRMCARCSTELSPLALVCPACSALVHRGKLEDLARLAEAAAVEGDHAAARAHWLEARELVPARSEQHELIGARIADLTSRIEAAPPQPSNRAQGSWTGRSVGVAAAIGLLLVGKLKFLLLSLSKLSTVASIHHFAVSAIVANVVQREVAGDVKHPRPRAGLIAVRHRTARHPQEHLLGQLMRIDLADNPRQVPENLQTMRNKKVAGLGHAVCSSFAPGMNATVLCQINT
jgi:hypothetical protein